LSGSRAPPNGGELFGTVEAGKSADVLILNGDPLADMRRIRDFETLIVRGRVIGRSSLSYQSCLNEPAQ
jgi:imidazolonepropionase-like amidohydrolase